MTLLEELDPVVKSQTQESSIQTRIPENVYVGVMAGINLNLNLTRELGTYLQVSGGVTNNLGDGNSVVVPRFDAELGFQYKFGKQK